MIKLPEGFDLHLLFSDFFHLAAPFAGIAMIISCGLLIVRLLKSSP
jgi:hypothetical protein